MYCPLRVIANCTLQKFSDIDTECIRTTCAWWNQRFAMCAMAVDAYLKGQEDLSNERLSKEDNR